MRLNSADSKLVLSETPLAQRKLELIRSEAALISAEFLPQKPQKNALQMSLEIDRKK